MYTSKYPQTARMSRTKKLFFSFFVVTLTVFLIFGHHYYPSFSETTTTTTAFNVYFPPGKQTVFFLETSGTGTLGLRQLASVEAAARFIPNSDVIVFVFTNEKYNKSSHMIALEQKYNIQFKNMTFQEYISKTPLEPWYKKGKWSQSPYMVSHMSDALRFLSLWKFGGIYFDLDVILTRKWNVKVNTVAKEEEERLGSAVLVFKKNHPVLLNCLTWLEYNYEPNIWIANGPALITDKVNEYLRNDHRPDNITVLTVSAFFEINYSEFEKFFETNFTKEVLNRTKSSFGVHIWNRLSGKISISKNSSCAYNVILSKSSPIIYGRMQIEN